MKKIAIILAILAATSGASISLDSASAGKAAALLVHTASFYRHMEERNVAAGTAHISPLDFFGIVLSTDLPYASVSVTLASTTPVMLLPSAKFLNLFAGSSTPGFLEASVRTGPVMLYGSVNNYGRGTVSNAGNAGAFHAFDNRIGLQLDADRNWDAVWCHINYYAEYDAYRIPAGLIPRDTNLNRVSPFKYPGVTRDPGSVGDGSRSVRCMLLGFRREFQGVTAPGLFLQWAMDIGGGPMFGGRIVASKFYGDRVDLAGDASEVNWIWRAGGGLQLGYVYRGGSVGAFVNASARMSASFDPTLYAVDNVTGACLFTVDQSFKGTLAIEARAGVYF